MLQTRIYVGKYSHLIGEQLDLLRFTVDDKLKVDNHIAEICRNVSQQIAVLKRMRNMLQIRKAINFAFIVLSPVVQRMDNAIQRISVNKTNHAIRWIVIYPVDSVIQPLNNRDLYFNYCADSWHPCGKALQPS